MLCIWLSIYIYVYIYCMRTYSKRIRLIWLNKMSGKYQTWDVFNHLVALLFAIDFSLLLYLPRDRSMIRQDKGWGNTCTDGLFNPRYCQQKLAFSSFRRDTCAFGFSNLQISEICQWYPYFDYICRAQTYFFMVQTLYHWEEKHIQSERWKHIENLGESAINGSWCQSLDTNAPEIPR